MDERKYIEREERRRGAERGLLEGMNYRPCIFCWDGEVILGSVGHDGEEVIETVRCRRCGGTGFVREV